MIKVLVAASGSYPRLGVDSVGHELRKAWHAFDRGKISSEEIEAVEDRLAWEIIKEQENVGVDIITDGLVRWYCPVSHIAGKMAGVNIGALHHFLDTNFHVRKAVVEELPQWKEEIITKETAFLKKNTRKDIKAVITGPATLLRYTDNKISCSWKKIGEAYTKALAREIENLATVKVPWIQIDDPCLLDIEENAWPLYSEWYGELKAASAESQMEVKTYGGAAGRLLPELFRLPVDYVGLDCISEPNLLEILKKEKRLLSQKGVALGIVDSRTKRLEDPLQLAASIMPLVEAAAFDVLLEPNYGLELNTRSYARKKLEILVEVRTRLMSF